MNKKLLPSEARKCGYRVDDSCYPWVAYKGPRFNPTIWEYCYTDEEEKLRITLTERDREIERLREVLVNAAGYVAGASILTKEQMLDRIREAVGDIKDFKMATSNYREDA